MPDRVIVYRKAGRRRSEVLCDALYRGLSTLGERVELRSEGDYRGPEAAVVAFYGMAGNLAQIYRDYRKAGLTAVCVDLGYWARRGAGTTGRFRGYHKVAVNARHPTDYFRRHRHDAARAQALGLRIEKWRRGGQHILVAAMGGKAARFEGFQPGEWERGIIADLRKVTDRPILFRPKPGDDEVQHLPGTIPSPKSQPLAAAFADCHAVVTHHSNVAVESLLAGVPVFCVEGVAAPLGLQDFARIEEPVRPSDRQDWLHDVTYCQWSVDEIAQGMAWRHLKDEGLVP